MEVKERTLISFMDRMANEHERKVAVRGGIEVYSLSLERYEQHLKDIEERDITTLRKR